MDEIRRQQFAIRSFTDSVELDTPPRDDDDDDEEAETDFESPKRRVSLNSSGFGGFISELEFDPEEDSQATILRGGAMKSSSTIDTIIEVIRSRDEEEENEDEHDGTLGETQKYVISVCGPGHVDQELELHQSLLRSEALDETSLRTPKTSRSSKEGHTPENPEEAIDLEIYENVQRLSEKIKELEDRTLGEFFRSKKTLSIFFFRSRKKVFKIVVFFHFQSKSA